MKAASIMLAVVAVAMAAVAAAQPITSVAALPAPEGMEPVWMVVSGAVLLGLASAVRRYIP